MSMQVAGTNAHERVAVLLARLLIVAISLCPLAAAAAGHGSALLQQVAKLEDPSGPGENRFGFAAAVSIDGRTALVGSRGDNPQGLHSSGAAHVYRRIHGAWVHEAKLLPPEPVAEGFFGVAVALSGDGNLALVGASSFFAFCGEPICGGAAYFFERDRRGQWHLIQTLTSPDGGLTDAFGMGVALSVSGRVAAIGASRAGCPLGDPCGAVFVFELRHETWQLQQRLAPQTPDPFVSSFGTAVSTSLAGRTVLVGAEGAAFVFRREGQQWTEQAKLQQPSFTFGRSVALSGSGRTALVGQEGAAFVYTRDENGWNAGQQLVPGQLGVTDVAVAIATNGRQALLGASPAITCPNIGNCVALRLDLEDDSWTLRQTLTSSDSGGDNSFGDAVSLSATGKVALIGGAFQACFSNPGVCNGAAYIFQAVP
jgi:hypothetical protein